MLNSKELEKSKCRTKKVNFSENKTESKMESPTYAFREMNLVSQLIWKSVIKNKAVISWS